MKKNLVFQFGHSWQVLRRMVGDFDEKAWLSVGNDANKPARLALHILQATDYYLKDQSKFSFESGKDFGINSVEAKDEDLLSQVEILECIDVFEEKTKKWLEEIDLNAQQDDFPWTGETNFGVVIFLLRHSLFHLGELSGLLNESKAGDVTDHYVKALND